MTDKIMPTQADIAAAKPIAVRIMIGELTHDELVQSFARHAAQAREEGARMMREAAASLIANGRFLTGSSPPKLFANQVAPLIRALDPAEIVKDGGA